MDWNYNNTNQIEFPTGTIPITILEDAISNGLEKMRKSNTKLAYDPKGMEFLDMCKHVYSHDEFCTVVTEEKLYLFLFYQAHRNLRNRGPRKQKGAADSSAFNKEEYDSIMSNRTQFGLNNTSIKVGYDVINQSYSSVLKILDSQSRFNRVTKEQLRSKRVKDLLSFAKTRKKHLKKVNYAEKIDASISGYTQIETIPVIEKVVCFNKALFDRNSSSAHTCQGALRDRFCFLMTYCGILRGESLFLCELSDLLAVSFVNTGINVSYRQRND